ncbi:hypothetical protein K493DRAFT_314864, partial [Basidiobolus meristosporus CBS 931.73]
MCQAQISDRDPQSGQVVKRFSSNKEEDAQNIRHYIDGILGQMSRNTFDQKARRRPRCRGRGGQSRRGPAMGQILGTRSLRSLRWLWRSMGIWTLRGIWRVWWMRLGLCLNKTSFPLFG